MKAAFSVFLSCLTLFAQTATVRPEQVKAHEDFLASDALQGRGSATRDEWIAATYIASQFEGFGLKPPPQVANYVQQIGLESIQLDGKAQLRVGRKTLLEGTDFYLSASAGTAVSGAVQVAPATEVKSLKVAKGSIILVRGPADPSAPRAMAGLAAQGPALIITEASKTQLDAAAKGIRTRMATTIKGVSAAGGRPIVTTVLLTPSGVARLRKVKAGKLVSLTVHATPVTKSTYNSMAWLPGTDPAAGTILLTAHLDHLGVSPASGAASPANGADNIFNGANDDASGVTAVLELARALAAAPAPKRSILFICFGSEESGGYGARWFLENPPVPLKDLVANLEFEQLGVQQEKVPPGTMFFTGWERSNLGPVLKEHGALLSPDPFPQQNFFQRSDNYALALRGVVAQTASAGGEVPTYHRANDDVEHIDLALMTQLIQSMIEPIRWLANTDFKPAWNPGGQPGRN